MTMTPRQILANPPQAGPSLHPYFGRWLKDGLEAYLDQIGSGDAANERWVSPNAGPANAIGSAADPFNLTSAAALYAGDPISQALASYAAPANAGEELSPCVIHCEGGNYPNPALIRCVAGGYRYTIFLAEFDLLFSTGSSALLQPIVSPFGTGLSQALAIIGEHSSGWQLNGAITIDEQGLAAPGIVFLSSGTVSPTVGNAMIQAAPLVAVQQVILQDVTVASPIVLPTAHLGEPKNCVFSDTVTVLDVFGICVDNTFVGDFTIVPAGSTPTRWQNTRFGNAPILWTAPVTGARFDRDSAAAFAANNANAFAGGASINDYFAPDLESVEVSFDITPGGSTVTRWACPANRTVVRISLLTDDRPLVNTSTLALTGDGNNLLAAATEDLATLNNGVLRSCTLTAVLGDRALHEGSSIIATCASNAATTNGTAIRLVITMSRDNRPLN